jgi:hypothetical protein
MDVFQCKKISSTGLNPSLEQRIDWEGVARGIKLVF